MKHLSLAFSILFCVLALMPPRARAACSDGYGSNNNCCFGLDAETIGSACRTPTTLTGTPKDDLVGICDGNLVCVARPTAYAVNVQSYSTGMSGSCRVVSVRVRIRVKQVAGTKYMVGGNANAYVLGPLDSFVTLSREDILNVRLP